MVLPSTFWSHQMKPQPYTKYDLELGEQIVKELHGLKGFDAWAERIAKALASERGKGRIKALLGKHDD